VLPTKDEELLQMVATRGGCIRGPGLTHALLGRKHLVARLETIAG